MQPLTGTELYVMKCIWDADMPLTPNEIRHRLRDDYGKEYAYPTINTFLKHIMEKGYVSQNRENYSYRYAALVTEDAYREEELNSMKTLWYGGSMKKMAASVLCSKELNQEDKEYLKKLLDEE